MQGVVRVRSIVVVTALLVSVAVAVACRGGSDATPPAPAAAELSPYSGPVEWVDLDPQLPYIEPGRTVALGALPDPLVAEPDQLLLLDAATGAVIRELGAGVLPRFGDEFVGDPLGGASVSNRLVWLGDHTASPATDSGFEGSVRMLNLETLELREFGVGSLALFRDEVLTVERAAETGFFDIDVDTGEERLADDGGSLAALDGEPIRRRFASMFGYSVQSEISLRGGEFRQTALVVPASERVAFGFRSAVALPVTGDEVLVIESRGVGLSELYLFGVGTLTVRHLGTTFDPLGITVGADGPDLMIAWQASGTGERTLVYASSTGEVIALVGAGSPSQIRNNVLYTGIGTFLTGTLAETAIDLHTFEYLWALPHLGALSSDGRFVAIGRRADVPLRGGPPPMPTPEPVRGEPRAPILPDR